MSLGQCFTEGVLRQHLSKFGVQVELGTELVAIEQDAVTVTATVERHRRGGSKETERIQATYVIGGDGGKGERNHFLPRLG